MHININRISKWTEENQMLLNESKSKYMIFNYCTSYQFRTRLVINNSLLEQVSETRLLGLIVQDDLSWRSNTESLVKRAYARMIILRKLSEFNMNTNDMITIYVLFVRSILEQSSVVWSSSITQEELASLERCQKVALRIIFGLDYISYDHALKLSKLPKMEGRYQKLLLSFAQKCSKNEKTQDMLPRARNVEKTRNQENFLVPFARKERYFRSAIPTMARMLNES